MVFTVFGTIPAVLAIIIGILILIWPKALNYFVAIYLILVGLLSILQGYYALLLPLLT